MFGEIGARPPGARVVDVMNVATDGDTYVGWAQAVVHGGMQPLERRYNAGAIFKRARGEGRITRSEGLDDLLARYGEHVALMDLLRSRFAIIATGQGAWEDVGASWDAGDVLGSKGVPNRVDVWGPEWPHDWETWQRMLPQYLDELC